MALHKGAIDLHQGLLARELDCQGHEEPLQARIHHEGSGSGVHAGHIPAHPGIPSLSASACSAKAVQAMLRRHVSWQTLMLASSCGNCTPTAGMTSRQEEMSGFCQAEISSIEFWLCSRIQRHHWDNACHAKPSLCSKLHWNDQPWLIQFERCRMVTHNQ